MRALRHLIAALLGAAYVIAFLSGFGCGSPPPPEHEATGEQLFESPQANPILLSPDGQTLYVVVTTAGVVRVVNASDLVSKRNITVGTDPVSVALRPDGSELWVANHVSDSVNVISLAPGPSQYQIVETIQAVDTANLVTDFDEPEGIAFANDHKAYVALSSRNQIAVIDADAYTVSGFIPINAQEPRALVVRNGHLFVPAFESGNQSELSACAGTPNPNDLAPDGLPQCTFDFTQTNFAQNPQLVGVAVDIAKDTGVPDRDLFVFDTSTDTLSSVVEHIGTLLYGVAVDSAGNVFIAQTDARNLADGRAGTLGQGLADLQNRTFLNQIGVVGCSGGTCGAPTRYQLEPLPPAQPAAGEQLATPYGIAVSGDDKVLVVTAASSGRVAAVDAKTGQVLSRAAVGNGPRGVALWSDPQTGAPVTAWVLNTLDDSISKLDLTNPAQIVETKRTSYNGDPTPAAVRLGRIAFNSAAASTTGTFSCGSCHPDGHVDQLLWVIGARCTFSGCNQEEARSTMPVRGLRGTLPLHWDGTLGDPFAGRNGEVGANGTAPANCTTDQTCFRQLVNASLGGVMCDQSGNCPINDVGQAGGLADADRDAMATYLQSIMYPPARTRRFDDVLTTQAVNGFSDFFENKGGVNPPGSSGLGPETCGDAASGSGCHALPFTSGTASQFVGGFEAPTMRGITDRYLQFSAGVSNVRDLLAAATAGGATDAPWSPAVGYDEFTVWAAAFGSAAVPGAFRTVYNVGPFDIFEMIEEMSNGQSGALGRQVTLNLRSTTGSALATTTTLLAALESADLKGVANLKGSGFRNGSPITLSFRSDSTYQGGGLVLTRAQLLSEAAAGTTTLTLTANQRGSVGASTVEPSIWVPAVGGALSAGRPNLPALTSGNPAALTLQARDIQPGATALVDGAPVGLDAPVTCSVGGTLPNCLTPAILVDLSSSPATVGMHMLQLQNPNGLLTNELPFRRN